MISVNQKIEIFFSYAHQDEELRDELAKHLKLLQRQGIISTWYDRDINVGTDWAEAIDTHLNSAQIILLLISPDFMASDYCFDLEMRRAMERHEAGEAVVIPIILRPVDWTGAVFSKLQGLQKNAKPVTTWSNHDEAFLDIAQGIRRTVERINMSSPGNQSEPIVKLKQSSLTATQRRHLEQQLKEQKQEYDYRNQEIEFLTNSARIDDLRSQERFRLTQQIAEAQKKRDQAAKIMGELEEKLNS
ncbi:MAG: toll/interleukin-1 receptor domain-containing protein [Cyanobacteria bacterium P01_F01_bin.143]